ncbi:MAG: FAD-dependent oxidoreductase [Anaerolineaceae bacterium]
MSIQPIKFIAAENLHSAEIILKENLGKAKALAGGTDLMGTLKDAVHTDPPELLVGLKSVKEDRHITVEPSGLRIGALTTLTEIAKNPAIKKDYSLLAQAAASVASPQIRNIATIAGNLCQEPRCWYYRNPDNTFDCLRKGGRWCDALFAENRYHSIFGGMCVSSAPCQTGCPIHNGIPAYMENIREGKVEDAVEILLETNPLASITGRICSRYCEEDCNRHDFDEPVAIRNVERYLGDLSLENIPRYYAAPASESGKSVAIVGSGPAGLSAAYFLRKQGHSVTVYDQMPEAGGMLRYSIPEYRLPKAILRKQVQALENMGIQFQFNAHIGDEGLTITDLRAKHNGVFVATGLWAGRQLKIETGELLGSGLQFLINVQKGEKPYIGKKVLVIGGGSVAVDVALTARRLGASQVSMACLETLETMPAVQEDLVQAQEDGIQILPSWGPKRVLQQDGKLTGLELVRCTSVLDKNRRFAPVFDEAETIEVEADQILVAIGQTAVLDFANPVLQTEGGLIVTQKSTLATAMEGVFAGGDVTGDSVTVVQAMASGKTAAAGISAYLQGVALAEPTRSTGKIKLNINTPALSVSTRVSVPDLPVEQRSLNTEDKQSLSSAGLEIEAQRCANCGCVAVNASDVSNALIALDAQIITSTRTLAAEELFAATQNSTTVLAHDELIQEIVIPAPELGSLQKYLKFRIRNSIDFPIVSVAFKAVLRDGRYHDARLVLGAVSPIPLRAYEVENLLEDQIPCEMLASEAAKLAVNASQPLARNKAKVEIVKALVRKVLLAG